MSEPKLISPMLDNFDMGGPISDHDGVRCCPAMRKNSDDKYIVKIISVPASQTKLDALLLTGAYPDKNSALAYFKDQADGIADEKKILDNLAQLEGFVSFEDCQIVPMEDATGYDVYLLSQYRMTLERQITRAPMTQLAAVNLGLDLCAALSVCRRSGYLCVDVKPSNIYVVGDKDYRIGDLGFVRLNSLKYEALPDKYRSSYTAPELEDAFASLNDTLDIYSVGLILYQVFNGGTLPFSGQQTPNQKFDAPAYADEEMAAIILKACEPDPKDRWQDPVQMGQAIVSYMQKNGVNETPLTAEFFGEEVVEEPEETAIAEDIPEVIPDEAEEDVTAIIEENAPADEGEESVADSAEEITEAAEETSIEVIEETIEEVSEAPVEEIAEETSEALASEAPVEEVAAPEDFVSEDANEASQEESNDAPQKAAEDESFENLSFLDNIDEILADVGEDYDGVTDEVSEILDQIDELTAHQVPDPVVAPEPIEIKIPDPIVIEESPAEEEPDENEEVRETSDTAEETPEEDEAVSVQEEIPEEEMPYVPKKKRTGLVLTIIFTILIALAAGAYFFYTQYYLQSIHNLEVNGSEDKLQVQLTTDIDETLLTVVCSDSHGDKVSAPVVGGTAVFSGLSPDTAYTVSVEIDGFHELTGVTSKVYSTPVQTKLSQISVITGSEDGSVILNFVVEGPDSDQWNVIYNAEGEAERVTSFPAHMVTLTGLTVGKEYTFRLEPADEIYISGNTETTYVARNVVGAENLHITSVMDGKLTAQWNAPADETVDEWSVRCYNDAGYDQTVTTEETSVTFESIDEAAAYTVEVTAAGMSISQRVDLAANSVTVSEFNVDSSNNSALSLSWKASKDVPEGGWIVRYSVNDISAASSVNTNTNTAQIPVVPGGNYVFTIQDNAGNSVLGGPFTYTHAAATPFEGFSVTQSDITARLCKTPDAASWSYIDLTTEDYVNSFAAGDKISVVLALSKATTRANDAVAIGYAIYDEDNKLVSFAHDSQIWQTMWYQNYCELDIPNVPTEIGTYNVIVYFNSMEVGSQKFEITT